MGEIYNKIIYLLLSIFTFVNIFAQQNNFDIFIEPFQINNLGGVQAFAFGQSEGKWLILGGRLDGLHRRQPWASFDIAGHNNQLIVVDPISEQTWSASLSSLPVGIQEQLSSTNMEFHQDGDYLYCLGGYGFSNTENDHTTYPNLTAIKVSNVIDAVINQTNFTQYFRQITNTKFQVTGGHLEKINNNYFLLGGQKFIGRYNPMGPNNGPGFIQEYTNAIYVFNLVDDGINITITTVEEYVDTANLHRRDYNATAQILPNGEEGITMFSGVFQQNVDLPFLNAVEVNQNGYTVNNSFQQYYNHYHCPVLPMYSSYNNAMHNVFFGGIAQFYDDNGILVQDDNVPFVNTIARVTRDSIGNLSEYKLPVEMPSLLGASAEFIPNLNLPHYDNGVFKLDSLNEDSVLIGYILGGINSSEPNIFFINDGTQSESNNQIFKIYLSNDNSSVAIHDFNEFSTSNLNLSFFPNPTNDYVNISFNLKKADDIYIKIANLNGQLVDEVRLKNQLVGENNYTMKLNGLDSNSVYFITISNSVDSYTQKLILEDN